MEQTQIKIYQTIFALSAITFAVLSLFIATSLDLSYYWYIPTYLFFITIIMLLGILNPKYVFWIIILISPTLYKFNYLKVDISQLLPFVKISLPLNPMFFIYMLAILLGLITIYTNWKNIKQIPLFNIIVFFSFYVILSTLWSSYLDVSLIFSAYAIVPFSMYLYSFMCLGNKKESIKLIIISTLSAFLPAIIGIIQFLNKDYFYNEDSSLGRLAGTFAHPNTYGLFLFLIISLLLTFYLAKKNKQISKNKIIITSIILMSTLFILTYSRVSWACLFIFIFLLALTNKKRIFYFLSSLPLLALFALYSVSIKNRISELLNFNFFGSWEARLRIWQTYWEMIMKKISFGYGVGTSEKLIEDVKTWEGGSTLAHNDLLLHALELGLVGLFIFVVYTLALIYYLTQAWQKQKDEYTNIVILNKNIKINFKLLIYGFLAIVISLLIASIFESVSQKIIIQMILWSIAGSLLSLCYNKNYETK